MREKAIVVSVAHPNDLAEAQRSIDELVALLDTAGVDVVDVIVQKRRRIDPAFYVGKGKAKEIGELAQHLNVDAVVFDARLSPKHVRNLSSVIPVKVLDRVDVILDIFAQHAGSSEAKLQVELAQLQHRLARLRVAPGALSRLGGGIGTRGPGETKLEIDRRRIQSKIVKLKRKLRKIEKVRQQKTKQQRYFFRVALVGYTSAGKSTLMNRLTKSHFKESEKLFTTLDTFTRAAWINGATILVSDTVGFISNLPTELIAAFRSTLMVANEADLILVVVDVSKPDFERDIEVVESTLRKIGAGRKPRIYVFNKIDLLPSRVMLERLMDRYAGEEVVFVSAKTGEGLEDLKAKIYDYYRRWKEGKPLTPVSP
ncbi:MAG: GTPase HflX [Thermotogae bacterium]|nr:GTPase HflX [Thermotogota bacterium]